MSGQKIIQGLKEAVKHASNSPPDWCPQNVWNAAVACSKEMKIRDWQSGEERPEGVVIARAILAAKAEEREACAEYHDDLAAYHEACREESQGEEISHHRVMARSHIAAAAAIRKRGEA